MFKKHEQVIEMLVGSLCLNMRDVEPLLPDDESGDKIVLETILHTIHGIGSSVFNECKLESKTKNNLVGGNLDLIIGAEHNGDRPRIFIHNQVSGPIALYSAIVGEAKKRGFGLLPAKRARTECLTELLTFGKPLLELLALSQVCVFPNEKIPLVAIFGNRTCFRPILYFKKC